jgi:dTDP-4-amino-4,6-dideoxygalactose transaminase
MARPVRLNEAATQGSKRSTKLADRLVIACRENVRFLNLHLQQFEKYLELPELVDNALYLAYTIKVRKQSPVDALMLRKALAKAGIETSPAFSFITSEPTDQPGKPVNRLKGYSSRSDVDTQAFCLGCHQYLTILDLEHIIDTLESIFSRHDGRNLPSAEDHSSRN